MPRPREPIREFGNRAFTYSDARRRGISPSRLASNGLLHPYHGVRIDPESDPTGGASVRPQPDAAPRAEPYIESEGDAEALLLDRSAESRLHRPGDTAHVYAPRLSPGQFFSHSTALRLWGAPVPLDEADTIHVSAYRPAREPRTRGVTGHRLQIREPATQLIDLLPVEHPVRAWRQVAARWSRPALVAAGDFLLARRRPLATIDELAAELTTMRGPDRARRLLRDLRSGSESARESWLRLILYDAGLPEAELNWDLFDDRGRFVARLDLAYVNERVAVEYDGRQHATDSAQFARDADRWDAIRACGWTHVRVLAHHLRDGGAPAVSLVRRALR